MTKKPTIGVIGLGAIGMRHSKNLAILGCKVLGYDPKLPGNSTVDNLIKKSDAVVIASPTNSHSDLLDQIDKPIFMEKPLASQISGVRLDHIAMVGYNLRFHSCVIKAREWLDAGMIGRPLWANLVCAEHKKDYRDHVILNWSHEIDLALYLLGPAHVAASSACRFLADIVLWHQSGCQSTIHLDYITRPDIRQTLVVGSDATIIVDIANRQTWLRSASGTILDHLEGSDSFDQNYVDEIETFLARIDGKETVGCTAQEGFEVLKICTAAIQRACHA